MTDGTNNLTCNCTSEFLIVVALIGEQRIEACYEDETILRTGKRGRLK